MSGEQNDVLERIRVMAERAATDRFNASGRAESEMSRRPSWGPAIVIEGEMRELCISLGELSPDEPSVARVWGSFLDPKRYGIHCFGFELRVGTKRSGQRLFYAMRGYGKSTVFFDSGRWDIGPRWLPPNPDVLKSHEEFLAWRKNMDDGRGWKRPLPPTATSPKRRELVAQQEAVVAKAREIASTRTERYQRLLRATELAKTRIAEFGGSPHAQMTAGARLTGMCAVCARGLTDPLSLQRGVGPECWSAFSSDQQDRLADLVAKERHEMTAAAD